MNYVLLAVANLLSTLESLMFAGVTWVGRSLTGLLMKLVTRPLWFAGKLHWRVLGLLMILFTIGEALEVWRRLIVPMFRGPLW
jgi:hypothetical protein